MIGNQIGWEVLPVVLHTTYFVVHMWTCPLTGSRREMVESRASNAKAHRDADDVRRSVDLESCWD